MTNEIDTDYLVVGAGAAGMAFVDELLSSDRDARVILVDRRATPGGHWNDAYPFVRLHQPALFYGVSSEKLGSGGHDLASKGEILGYYDRVLRKLVRTGRVTFLSQCNHEGEGRARSLVSPDVVHRVRWRRRLVDATYGETSVPSTTAPKYDVERGVPLVPINGLARLDEPWARYVIIGAGKTGIDAVLHLLAQRVQPDAISWIMPRDAWLIDRSHLFPDGILGSTLDLVAAYAEASDVDDLCRRLEELGFFCRIDPERTPTAYRCATVSREELELLRSIGDVIRAGRVSRVTADAIHCDAGVHALDSGTLLVDCSTDGLARRDPIPVFVEDRITLQPIAVCQPAFSAALIAKLETKLSSDEQKNSMTAPTPYPRVPADIPAMALAHATNADGWARTILPWLSRCRLNAPLHAGFFANLVFTARVLGRLGPAKQNLERMSALAPL